MKVRVKKLTRGSLFKLVFISTAIPLFPFMILCGVASVFGAETVQVQGEYVTGPLGLVAALIMYALFTIIFSCVFWLFGSFGLWVYSKFRRIELVLVDAEIVSGGFTQNQSEDDGQQRA